MRRFCLLLLLLVAISVASLHPAGQSAGGEAVSFWKGGEAFASGSLLLDHMDTNKYNLYAVRRDKPGAVELHTLDTDIIFILEGSATFVTGGSVADSRVRGIEISGTAILNGEAREIGRGDVIMVPNGTPHWFREVSPAINYFAVKLRQTDSHTPVPSTVRFWKGSDVFAGGGLVFDGKEGTYVRVYALRRDKPLGVELHALDTDVVFVTDGSGTFVTGGTIVEPRSLRENEGTGLSIAEGTPRSLSRGAVLVVPHGVPHWLRDINGNLEFFAVKVR